MCRRGVRRAMGHVRVRFDYARRIHERWLAAHEGQLHRWAEPGAGEGRPTSLMGLTTDMVRLGPPAARSRRRIAPDCAWFLEDDRRPGVRRDGCVSDHLSGADTPTVASRSTGPKRSTARLAIVQATRADGPHVTSTESAVDPRDDGRRERRTLSEILSDLNSGRIRAAYPDPNAPRRVARRFGGAVGYPGTLPRPRDPDVGAGRRVPVPRPASGCR